MMNESSDPKPEARISEIRKLLKKPNSEDQRFRNLQLLRKADAWLSGYILEEGSSEQLVLLHIKVLRALKDMGRVIESVKGRKWLKKRIHARALLESAKAYVGIQDFLNAGRCLDRALVLDPGVEAAAGKTRKVVEEQLRFDTYGRLSAFIYHAVKSGQVTAAKHLYRSALHVYGMPVEVADQAVGVLSRLNFDGDLNAESQAWVETERDCASRLIMTCGSGYSGTGAVTAFLRELEGLPMPFGVRELAVLKKNYGLYRLVSKWTEWGAEERKQALQEAVLKAVLGIPCYETVSSVDRVHSRSITWNSLFMDEGLDENNVRLLGAYSVDFINGAMRASTTEQLEEVCSSFLNGVLRAKGGRYVLLNNCVHQTQVSMCGLLNNSKVIVVVRDPRDQYVAHQTETPRNRITVESFIRKRKRADAAVRRYLQSGRSGLKVFGFEEFVGCPGVRQDVLDWAGLSRFSPGSKARFFFPEKSMKNVGIYKEWEEKSEIRMIENELGDQLVD